jgi:hypothetical protein
MKEHTISQMMPYLMRKEFFRRVLKPRKRLPNNKSWAAPGRTLAPGLTIQQRALLGKAGKAMDKLDAVRMLTGLIISSLISSIIWLSDRE